MQANPLQKERKLTEQKDGTMTAGAKGINMFDDAIVGTGKAAVAPTIDIALRPLVMGTPLSGIGQGNTSNNVIQ